MTKAPLAALGGGSGPNPTDRGKRGVKRSVATEAAGRAGRGDGGRSESSRPSVAGRDARPPRGAPAPAHARPAARALPRQGLYDYASTRAVARRLRLSLHLRTRGEEVRARRRGRKARRWVVERAHSWLNRFRRLLVRWEKKASTYQAMLHLACATIVAGQAGLFG